MVQTRRNRFGVDILRRVGVRVGFVLAWTCAALGAQADTTLVLFRHGEKPAQGLGQLSCQGLNRALALPGVLVAQFGTPQALYAPNPGVTAIDRGTPYHYIRPLATIEPTAIRLGLPVNTTWGLTSLNEVGAELLSPAHRGQTLFVAWEHHLLVRLTRALVAEVQGDPTTVPDWPDDDFDTIFVVRIPLSGPARFERSREGLDGLSSTCPGAG